MTSPSSAKRTEAGGLEQTDFGAGPGADVVTAELYRAAMAQLASAVHLITTDGAAGRAGFTASAVCSVSDRPPTLLVCVNRSASAFPFFDGNDVLCVNTLAENQTDVAGAFGGRTPMNDRFACARWTTLATGSPVLEGALVAFDCRITDRRTMSTHDILFCEVVRLGANKTGLSLVYADRRYHTLKAFDLAGPGEASQPVADRSRKQPGRT